MPPDGANPGAQGAHKQIESVRKLLGELPLAIGSGEPVLLPFPAANRDEREFPDPDRVVLDRAPNRHVAFGAGIHRCIGAHLARMEMRVALDELLSRIPDFHLADPEGVAWKAGPIRGPRNLEVAFGPANLGLRNAWFAGGVEWTRYLRVLTPPKP